MNVATLCFISVMEASSPMNVCHENIEATITKERTSLTETALEENGTVHVKLWGTGTVHAAGVDGQVYYVYYEWQSAERSLLVLTTFDTIFRAKD